MHVLTAGRGVVRKGGGRQEEGRGSVRKRSVTWGVADAARAAHSRSPAAESPTPDGGDGRVYVMERENVYKMRLASPPPPQQQM